MSALGPRARAAARSSDTLVNALSLFATTILTSVFVFAFWFTAARTFTPAAVGAAGADLSIMQLIAITATVGLGTLLIAELSRVEYRSAELMTTAALGARPARSGRWAAD